MVFASELPEFTLRKNHICNLFMTVPLASVDIAYILTERRVRLVLNDDILTQSHEGFTFF